MHNRAVKSIAKSGDLIKQANGVVKENPYIGIAIKAANIMSQLGTKLGITNNAMEARGVKGTVPKPKSKLSGLYNG